MQLSVDQPRRVWPRMAPWPLLLPRSTDTTTLCAHKCTHTHTHAHTHKHGHTHTNWTDTQTFWIHIFFHNFVSPSLYIFAIYSFCFWSFFGVVGVTTVGSFSTICQRWRRCRYLHNSKGYILSDPTCWKNIAFAVFTSQHNAALAWSKFVSFLHLLVLVLFEVNTWKMLVWAHKNSKY